MKKYGGDLTNYGQTGSLHLKNIGAYYKAPKTQVEFQEMLEYDENMNIANMSYEEIMSLIPENWHDESGDYWADIPEQFFNAKDGQTNAYVKRGTDEEVEEYFEREETTVYSWHIATDENHINFVSGGKVRAKGIDWFILKVIQQDSTGTYANKYFAMDTNPNNERLKQMGLKTLVCIGGM